MSEDNLIQWTSHKYWTKVYNPFVGCKPVSEGCDNCWAKSMTERFGLSFEPHPTGQKPPKKGVVFVGNMTDIFGEWVMPERCSGILNGLSTDAVNLILTKRTHFVQSEIGYKIVKKLRDADHIWWGVTAENQKLLNGRLSSLFYTHLLKVWISLEPLLEEIDLCANKIFFKVMKNNGTQFWVVVGAESGNNRRPCKIEWVEKIVEDCREMNIPVFVKQLEINGKLVRDISKFPKHLQIRQVPWEVKK